MTILQTKGSRINCIECLLQHIVSPIFLDAIKRRGRIYRQWNISFGSYRTYLPLFISLIFDKTLLKPGRCSGFSFQHSVIKFTISRFISSSSVLSGILGLYGLVPPFATMETTSVEEYINFWPNLLYQDIREFDIVSKYDKVECTQHCKTGRLILFHKFCHQVAKTLIVVSWLVSS